MNGPFAAAARQDKNIIGEILERANYKNKFFSDTHCGFSLFASPMNREGCLKQERNSLLNAASVRWVGSRAFLMVCALTFGSMAAPDSCGAEINPSREQIFDIDIPSQNAADALSRLAEQTGALMLFPYDLAKSRKTRAVSGRHSLTEALAMMLEGSGLAGGFTDKQVIQITVSQESVVESTADVNNETDLRGNEGMTENKTRRNLLAAAIASIFAGTAQTAISQEAADDQDLEEITVTGSRIRQTSGMTTPTPVTTMTTTELSIFDPGTTISEQLDNLPQFFQTQTAQRGGGTLVGDASGSYLNLRGMGKNRTLVLFDGSRIVPADRASSVNIDNFPTALIRSVDVVTGGASAAYGADAIAGVVNFVLDREFEGLKLNASTGRTGHGDGDNWSFSVAGGRQFGSRLNLIGSVEARRIDEIYRDASELDNFQSWGFVRNPAWRPGATGVPQRITLPDVHSTIYTAAGMINEPGFVFNRYTFTGDGLGVRRFVTSPISSFGGSGTTNTQSGGPEALMAARSFDQGVSGTAVNQSSGFVGLKYTLSDNVELFGQLMLGRTEASTSGRRGNPHMQTDTWNGTVFVDNAYLPEVVRQAMIDAGLESIRIDKLGQVRSPSHVNWYDNRGNEDVSIAKSGTVGFDWRLPNDWNLRASYQRGLSHVTTAAFNIQRTDRFFLAMDAVRDPATGAIVCNSTLRNPSAAELAAAMQNRPVSSTTPPTLSTFVDSPVGPDDPIRNCVPINVFGLGNASEEAANWVVDNKTANRRLDQDFAEILLTGELFEGIGAGPVSFASGLTYREESFYQFAFEAGQTEPRERGMANVPELGIRGIPDGFTGGGALELNQFSGTSQATGGYDVWEWFGELNVPLWESSSGNQSAVSNVAYRSSDYSTSGRIESWKLGLDFQVINDLRLRVTKSRDVREPSLAEQFEIGGGGGNVFDPAFGGALVETTSLRGNNPNLAPEKADTLTAGFVYQPSFASFIDGLQLSVDWYEIDLSGAVGQLGNQRIVDGCFYENIADLCELVERDPALGTIQRIINQVRNINAAHTEGVDFELQYNRELDFFSDQTESLSLRGFAGYLIENSDTPWQGNTLDQAGSVNRPEWRASITGSYEIGPYGVRLQQNYIDSTLINIQWIEGRDIDDNTISSQSVTNLALSYTGEGSGNSVWRASLNVNNLFDRDPPVIPSISTRGGSQTVSTNYDVYGRRYQLSLSMDF